MRRCGGGRALAHSHVVFQLSHDPAGIVTVGIAAGQGAVALVTGSVLTQLGRGLHATVLLGLLVGLFDFVMNFLQMAVPATELGWIPDLVILAVATIVITVLGSRSASAPATPP